MKRRHELAVIAGIAYWAALLGVVAPNLISAPDTFLVLLGITLLAGSAYATYRVVRRAHTKKEPAE